MNGTGNESGNAYGNRQGSGNDPGKRRMVLKKAYEISYAVFRIASRMGNTAFREHLERQALSLLDAATVENYGWVNMVSRAIEYLMRFGGDVGLIHEANKETIIGQLNELDAYVAGPEKAATAEPVPLSDIFSDQEPLFGKERRHREHAREQEPYQMPKMISHEREDAASIQGVPDASPDMTDAASGSSSGVAVSPEIRQMTIIEKIRQSGNCRLRDLMELLPDYSERTLRYDLQTLAQQNVIERIGNGGPSVYYRIRQSA